MRSSPVCALAIAPVECVYHRISQNAGAGYVVAAVTLFDIFALHDLPRIHYAQIRAITI
jgi:hypothetical protein